MSIDNFSNSSPAILDLVEKLTGVRMHNHAIDLCDTEATSAVLAQYPGIQGIIHFAAYKAVGESVEHPVRYFRNNLNSLINIAAAARDHNVPCLVYSSSCTVYGNPEQLPVREDSPLKPAESPYGRTKQMGEQILHDIFLGLGTQVISLRYFNPAGAHPSGAIGEAPSNPALNLVPVITETAAELREALTVFGDDYPTRDGTCIRDYVHVMDLARAHTLALEACMAGTTLTRPVDYFNLGIGEGVTVLEAIHAFEKVSGTKLNYHIGPRRDGDIPATYADYAKAKALFGWTPRYGIDEIMATAWVWEQKRTEALSRQ